MTSSFTKAIEFLRTYDGMREEAVGRDLFSGHSFLIHGQTLEEAELLLFFDLNIKELMMAFL
jgi:hypothetical protein